MSKCNTIQVGILQRYIPHYRYGFFSKLNLLSKYDWKYICGSHPGSSQSGLPAPELEKLPIYPISAQPIAGSKLLYLSGVLDHIHQQALDTVVFEGSLHIVSNFQLLAYLRKHRIPAVAWSKGLADNQARRARWRRWVEGIYFRQCNAIIAYGNLSATYFRDLGYPAEQIFVAQNTVDVTEILNRLGASRESSEKLRRDLGLQDQFVIGYLGRLVRSKGVDRIIAAFALARQQGLNAVLVIAGSGPEASSLQELACSIGSHDVIRFIGTVPPGFEGAYFQLFDLVVSFRGAGLAIPEAMAHGKVVLMTPEARPEAELIQDGVTGLHADGFEIDSFANAMIAAAAAPLRLREIGKQAQAVIAENATFERMIQVFDQAVDTARQRGQKV